jgi:DNA-binding transcriptional regulator GbsR (MarR family)
MSEVTEQVLNSYVTRTGTMFEDMGLSRTCGELGALLYLSRDAMSLGEIAETLKVSKSSVSLNARMLLRMKFVKTVKKAGDRKDYYQFSGNLWPSIKEAMDAFVRGQVNDFKELNNECIPLLDQTEAADEEDQERREYLIAQLRDLRSFYYFTNITAALTDLFKTRSYTVINTVFKNTVSKTFKKIWD